MDTAAEPVRFTVGQGLLSFSPNSTTPTASD